MRGADNFCTKFEWRDTKQTGGPVFSDVFFSRMDPDDSLLNCFFYVFMACTWPQWMGGWRRPYVLREFRYVMSGSLLTGCVVFTGRLCVWEAGWNYCYFFVWIQPVSAPTDRWSFPDHLPTEGAGWRRARPDPLCHCSYWSHSGESLRHVSFSTSICMNEIWLKVGVRMSSSPSCREPVHCKEWKCEDMSERCLLFWPTTIGNGENDVPKRVTASALPGFWELRTLK